MRKPDDASDIMKVIALETDRFLSRDFDGWANCWVHDERTREVCISPSFGATVLEGWDALSTYMKDVIESGATCDVVEFQRQDEEISMSGDIAHVVFNGISKHANGRVEETFETRVLEKKDDGWRILFASFMLRGHQKTDVNKLAVDENGKILCAPDEARALIAEHAGLQISNNRLRAARRSWDQTLQNALKCAAEQHGYFQHYRYLTERGRNFRLPVVLGETDEGSVVVCVLFVRDGVTFVEAESDGDINVRLNIAQTIFGLSAAQMELARCIVQGNSLVEASKLMGISKNTAKTHLVRVYQKTGVNSQTALVRALLSVG